MSNLSICVVGAGVAGLSTAHVLHEQYASAQLTIVSDAPFEQTTSYGPAGMFRPYIDEYIDWSRTTLRRFEQIYAQYSPAVSGLSLCSGHILGDDLQWLHKHETLGKELSNFAYMKPNDIKRLFSTVDRKYGLFYTTYMSHGKYYVPFLRRQLSASPNVRFKHEHVTSLADVAVDYDIVVNATGLASATLADDPLVRPNRGVLIGIYGNGARACYLLCKYAHGRLRVYVQNARVTGEWLGLRPERVGGPRVAVCSLTDAGGARKMVVHNYGHAGHGFELSWGCATDAGHQFATHWTAGTARHAKL